LVVGAIDTCSDIVAARFEVNALRACTYVDALFFEEASNGRGDVFVFTRDEAGGLLDDGDFASEAAEDLPEFEADVAAAYDNEMARQSLEFEDADVVHPGDSVDSRKVWDDGATSNVDEDFFGGEEIVWANGFDWVIRSRRGR
jgi:hypothetical protein